MIRQNVGKIERVIRIVLAALLCAWVLQSDALGVAQYAALLAAAALTWNAFFGRCYLWKWLGLNSCEGRNQGDEEPECGCNCGTKA